MPRVRRMTIYPIREKKKKKKKKKGGGGGRGEGGGSKGTNEIK